MQWVNGLDLAIHHVEVKVVIAIQAVIAIHQYEVKDLVKISF